MRQIFIIFLLFSTLSFAGENIDIESSSKNTISLDVYQSNGKVLFLYLPSERGFGNGYVPTAQQLAFSGIDVWVADLHESYMISEGRSSIDKFEINDIVEIISIAKTKGYSKVFFITSGRGAKLALRTAFEYQKKYPKSNFISGHIFHSPHLISGAPLLGEEARYIDSAKFSNLPIYIILPQNSTKFLRSKEISNTLKKGGSSVFTHLLRGVSGGFEMRAETSLTETDLKYKSDLTDIYLNATQLMSTVVIPKIVKNISLNKVESKSPLYDPKLIPFQGNPAPPELILSSINDKTIDINDYKGRVVLINFWASWCKPCVKEIPSLVRLYERLSNEPFDILTVNIGEDKKSINEFLNKIKFDLPILLDTNGVAVRDWKVYAYPSNFVLDKQGKIRYAYRGALEWDSDNIVKEFEDLL